MISEIDIYRAANLLIERHGADAEVEAARRLISCSIAGTLMGNSFWLRIKQAIAEFKPRWPDHCARAVGSTD